ncbi:MAG: hypothetical protein M1823_000640 [Watsoniomyces obsoletus]|nr:MAG: hypothetical protein M1823_000640 [Watsoniomyces obsoletus]
MSNSISDSISLINPSPPSPDSPIDSDDNELDSLPSTTDSESETEEDGSDAEREWRESLEQIELLLTMVVVPYLGKYFGRKCAYWGWARWMEWRYPVEVVITNKAAFKGTGAVVAAASL